MEVQFYCLTRAEPSAFLRVTQKVVVLGFHVYQLNNFGHQVLLSLAVHHEEQMFASTFAEQKDALRASGEQTIPLKSKHNTISWSIVVNILINFFCASRVFSPWIRYVCKA